MRTMRTYSVFVKEDGKYKRVTPLALRLDPARRIFQGFLMHASLTGRDARLKPAAEDYDREAEYAANKARIFPELK